MEEIVVLDEHSIKISLIGEQYQVKKLMRGVPRLDGTWHMIWLTKSEMQSVFNSLIGTL